MELLSNFPFGSFMVTGEWLLLDVRDPDGNVKPYTREIVDRLGFEKRQNGGSIAISIDTSQMSPLLTDLDLFTVNFAPAEVPIAAIDFEKMGQISVNLMEVKNELDKASEDGASSNGIDAMQQAKAIYEKAGVALTGELGDQFYALLDNSDRTYNRQFLSQLYPDSPRIVIVSQQSYSNTVKVDIDLQEIAAKVIPFPEQVSGAEMGVRYHPDELIVEVDME